MELFECERALFVEVVGALSEVEGDVFPLHTDVYSLIIRILEDHCNLGGI